MVKLVVHIGFDASGSAAIAARLAASRHALRAAGVAVLEAEHAFGQASGMAGADPAEAGGALFLRLSRAMDNLQGARLAIWSDGALSAPATVPALRRLAQAGHEVEVQAYVPRHDRWLTGSYARWALGQKMAGRPVPAFTDWLRAQEACPSLASQLAAWEAGIGPSLRLFNAGAVGDVAAHFFGLNGIAEHLTAQPVAADPGRIFPTRAPLADLAAAQAEDIAAINAMLAQSGQPPLDHADPSPRPLDPQTLRLLCMLAEEAGPDCAESETAALARQLAARERQVQALSMQLRRLDAPRAEAYEARLRLALALDDPQALVSPDAVAAEVQRLRTDLAAAEAAAEAARRRVEALEASTSWRLTAPLRALGRRMGRPRR
jgi:hypothetical protein